MAKGYWIVHVDVSNPDAYGAYVKANAAAFSKYGARFLVRGGKFETVEGGARARNVVIEFDSFEKALACYRSPEYAAAIEHRKGAAIGDIIVIEGYEGPQPA
ncbi:MAG: DUF1330 domain-containing protein [Hyphomicrobiales bacterium]|nr:DUF1330 domain-containing protein [Hyphomicrobiales bacterium]